MLPVEEEVVWVAHVHGFSSMYAMGRKAMEVSSRPKPVHSHAMGDDARPCTTTTGTVVVGVGVTAIVTCLSPHEYRAGLRCGMKSTAVNVAMMATATMK